MKDYRIAILKGRNLAWLVATLVLDVLILMVLAFQTTIQDLTPTALAAVRTGLIVLLPIPALLLSALISPDQKAVLVFWRFTHPLPGARAFSVHAPADHRIDLAKLKRNIGEFPVSEREQNTRWYSLYKQVDSEPAVVESHRSYLLFRDIAAMSLLLVPVLPIVMYLVHVEMSRTLISMAWFFGQYLVTALAARTTAIRFVKNVLAIHASQDVASRQSHRRATK